METPNVWQIASGDSGRSYASIFLEHDLMFLGPGRFGPYEESEYRKVIERSEYTSQKIGAVRSFCTEVRPGDFVLLRDAYRVVALGLVVADDDGSDGYRYDQTFDDVYGWDLEHTRRVVWQDQLGSELAALQENENELFRLRKQIPMFTRVKDAQIRDQVVPLTEKCDRRLPKDRPSPLPSPLALEEVGQKLFFQGLANEAVDNVLRAIERQRRLLGWYNAQGSASLRPDEHEVVAHLVLPLLLALGWSEQLLAIEWQKVDLAAFWGTPTTSERCVLVCEAKRMRHGLQDVWDQAVGYVKNSGLQKCGKILLTQGARFYLYEKEAETWPNSPEPVGYVNLERIRENHIAPANTNAIDTLMALTPAGVQRTQQRAP